MNDVEKLRDKSKVGFYLTKTITSYDVGSEFGGNTKYSQADMGNAKYIMFNEDSDELHDYLESILGKWTAGNADKWSEYVVEEITKGGDIDLFSW